MKKSYSKKSWYVPRQDEIETFSAHLDAMFHHVLEGCYEMSHQTMTRLTLSNPQYIVTKGSMMPQPALNPTVTKYHSVF